LNWYLHLPKPRTVSWIINLPDAVAPSDEFQEQNLTITFDKSVAKLAMIGKEVRAGESFSEDEGQVVMVRRHATDFHAGGNWPAAKTYRIKLSRGLFAPHTRLEMMSQEFHTPPFTVAISDLKFYVSPKDPTRSR